MSYSQLKGVGGWLGFLVVSMGILSPARALLTNASELESAEAQVVANAGAALWSQIVLVSWTTTLIQSAILITGASLLVWRWKPSTPRWAIACLWIGGPGMTIVALMALGAVLGASVFTPESIIPLLGVTFWCGVWTAYLLMSERVRNTYTVDADDYFAPEPSLPDEQQTIARG